MISIHALREEGDVASTATSPTNSPFLSTPSARRATGVFSFCQQILTISIHALREEGDIPAARFVVVCRISIHALREEGDIKALYRICDKNDFYPRPPRGGRPYQASAGSFTKAISIHALREEGDLRAVGI